MFWRLCEENNGQVDLTYDTLRYPGVPIIKSFSSKYHVAYVRECGKKSGDTYRPWELRAATLGLHMLVEKKEIKTYGSESTL